MKINPVKGTADYLPSQARVRDYLQKVILDTYRAAGFERIMPSRIWKTWRRVRAATTST